MIIDIYDDDMTEKTEEVLVKKANSCDDCLCWLDHCRAECCYHFSFRLNPLSDVIYEKDVVMIRLRITPDLRKYLDLHGVIIDKEIAIIPRDRCNIAPDRISVTARCVALEENCLCRLHPEGKPDYCKALTWETAQRDGYEITPRCLFGYKLKALSGGDAGHVDSSD
jgi:hypothetical protein